MNILLIYPFASSILLSGMLSRVYTDFFKKPKLPFNINSLHTYVATPFFHLLKTSCDSHKRKWAQRASSINTERWKHMFVSWL